MYCQDEAHSPRILYTCRRDYAAGPSLSYTLASLRGALASPQRESRNGPYQGSVYYRSLCTALVLYVPQAPLSAPVYSSRIATDQGEHHSCDSCRTFRLLLWNFPVSSRRRAPQPPAGHWHDPRPCNSSICLLLTAYFAGAGSKRAALELEASHREASRRQALQPPMVYWQNAYPAIRAFGFFNSSLVSSTRFISTHLACLEPKNNIPSFASRAFVLSN